MGSRSIYVLFTVFSLAACRSPAKDAPSPTVEGAAPADKEGAIKAAVPEPKGTTEAVVGQLAPDFTLSDLDGKSVKLSDFKGKTVVLEWFNPDCPFVRNSHTKGSLVGTADRHQSAGGVWLAINSGAPGKQGAGREKSQEGKQRYNIKHPILLDESGQVGKLYGAKTTPHMYVIAPDGSLVYHGAIDNSPDGEGESPTSGKLVNYVDEAIAAVKAGKAVAQAQTEPYGCSVKYVD